MTTTSRFCRKCGAIVPTDSPEESCGACLLERGLDPVEPEHEVNADLALEIAHVLLIDVVGYSKLLVNEQIELLQNLNQIVRATESFRAAEATGKLIRVPTGDGMALLFFHSPEEPVRCALEISRALQEHPHIRLRMGVHSGPINRIPDVNDKTNIAGSGINVAQRVLDCGDAGHILLSKHIAEDLASYRQWQPFLHDLGECEVKHGLRLHLFNLYKDSIGNPQIPEKLRRRRRGHGAGVTIRPPPMLIDFGDYELLEQIGRGGQGVVFRARQKSLNRTVALKVINLGQWSSKAHVKRFRREAEAAASLDHAGIVPIHEVGERDGSCYFSMKFVEGGQLDEVVRRSSMSIRQAAELIAKVARIVHYAHEHGILHRDIKPGNILLDANGEPHLTDFGLARLLETESSVTQTLDVLGTPSYMAPEQAVGNNAAVSSATDVYGLGAVLYQLLTGQPPFAGGTTYETIKLLLDTEPRQPRLLNPKIDRDLSTICLKCLEKDPKRRYSSALALAEDLEHWLRHEPILARRTGIFVRGKKWVRRNPSSALLTASLIALAAAAGWILWKSELIRSPLATGIAVLPFENLSEQREDAAAFVDGVQDDVLTKLAKIADLKVISRTSVMEYRDKRNVRQIGNDLRVSHVLEGSVRRIGTHLHLNAQLIDARTDTHLWAEQYDRDLNEVFSIQSDIARKVAEQLNAKITAAETAAIEQKPTGDLVAFELYSRANDIWASPLADFPQVIDLLNQAVARDPSFFDAYCYLARAHDQLYFFGHDHTPARLAAAEAALKEAFRIRPNAGEAHLARAWHLYNGHLDYDAALAELQIARRSLPNAPGIFSLTAYIQRRQGRWEEAIRNLERAIELDPRDLDRLYQIGVSYWGARRYAEVKSKLDRMLTIAPNDIAIKAERAFVEVDWKADTGPLHQLIDEIRATNPAAMPKIASRSLLCALAERDVASAKDALPASDDEFALGGSAVNFTRPFAEGVIARMTNDEPRAQLAFTAARVQQEKTLQAQPNYGPAWCVLGVIDAALGRKEEALREGRRAVELLPVEKDPINGTLMIEYLAMIAAWVGEKDLACEQLATAVRFPTTGLDLSYGQLKLMPFWDPLRADPRFEKIVASLAPKGN
jgi:TolB-like protein/class 3 adenylate cyclase/Tfp pilus assembly protein PilF/predicted Ser/Thr protein kinase